MPAQIKQVLVNLIKNAIQAMTRGGVLTLQTGSQPDGVWLIVSGYGRRHSRGANQPHLRAVLHHQEKRDGLGLMIVQRIVRDHGGRIELESHVGQGTTFRIWLPRQERQTRLLERPAQTVRRPNESRINRRLHG